MAKKAAPKKKQKKASPARGVRKSAARKTAPKRPIPKKPAPRKPDETRGNIRRIVFDRFSAQVLCPGPVTAIVTDLGLTGLGVIVQEPLKIGVKVTVQLRAKGLDGELRGKVAWCRAIDLREGGKGGGSTYWRAGFDFAPIDPDSAALLKAIFDKL